MPDPELKAYDEVSERKLYLLSLDRPEDVPERIALSSSRFVCLIAWDATQSSVDDIARVARKLLDSGAVYISAWGSGCERVHEIFDEVIVESGLGEDDDTVVMTTWHDDEPLAEAVWFVLRTAWPADGYEDGCDATLGLSIGSPASAAEMRSAFSDSAAFTAKILESE
jgi:hypothetical protein